MEKILGSILFYLLVIACSQKTLPLKPNSVLPTPGQISYQEMELIGFIHFNINTFTDREWGYGDESPEIFNPTQLDAEQWVTTAKAAGIKQLILTAKHHDGFCLWPSKFTDHSVRNSPWKNGKGDIIREFTRACRKHGLKAGLYLSPWDRNHADYGKPEYIIYYKNQLKELLTNYGKVAEMWFDGANGGDGYYGGAREERRIDRKTYYNWPSIFKYVKQMQPDILIFSDAGPDIRWIGNEKGFAGETNWSMINIKDIIIGEADTKYLNSGDPQGESWVVGECDVSIRPGWFYHKQEDQKIKSLTELLNIYYRSVGRNSTLLLNIPPDMRGLIPEGDVKRLREFGAAIRNIFKTNLAKNKIATLSDYRDTNDNYHARLLLDGDDETFWATNDGVVSASVVIDLKEPATFDLIVLKEYIPLGQRVKSFYLESFLAGQWQEVARGTTIGCKRILKIPAITSTKLRLVIEDANACPLLSGLEVYKQPSYL